MEDYKDPKLVGAVSTGREPVYEVFDQSEQRIRIRHGDHHERYIDIFKSALPILIQVLEDVNRKVNQPTRRG
jgi:hypothetical protein